MLLNMFGIEFTESAYDDLYYLKAFEQGLILDAIEAQLSAEPASPTKNRKPLRPNELSEWQLRVGKFRVFYDLDAEKNVVRIKAVGWKEHNALFIRAKEFVL